MKATFVISAVKPKDYPKRRLPQIALLGRSNVGKSSLINTLTKRKNLAHISGTPGKTRLVNFYLVEEAFYFVDLPGYGYAAGVKPSDPKWKDMIQRYLEFSTEQQILGSIMLLDARREILSENDFLMLDWLAHYQIKTIIAVTKIDKLSKNKVLGNLKNIKGQLAEFEKKEIIIEIIPFSAKTGTGAKEIWLALQPLLKALHSENSNIQ